MMSFRKSGRSRRATLNVCLLCFDTQSLQPGNSYHFTLDAARLQMIDVCCVRSMGCVIGLNLNDDTWKDLRIGNALTY